MEKEEKARNAKLKPKKRKLRLEGKHAHEYFCFCCGEGGELVMCDRKDCPKAYHLLCLNLTKPPYGNDHMSLSVCVWKSTLCILCFHILLIVSHRFILRAIAALKPFLSCFRLQGVGNVLGTTAAFVASRPRPSVTSALAHSAGSTRWGRSLPPPLKVAPVAPVTILSVPWTPTPAPPSYVTPPWAQFGLKRSWSQSRVSQPQSDTTAPLNTSFPVKCVLVRSTSDLKQLYKREYSAFWPVRRSPFRHKTHRRTPRCCLWQDWTGASTGEVSRHHCALFSLLSCHKTPPLTLSTARLCPSEGPDHHLIMFLFVSFTAVWNFKCCHIVSYRHFEEPWRVRWRGEVEEKRSRRLKAGPLHNHAAPLLVYLLYAAVGITHRMALRRRASPFLLPRSRSSLQTWSVIVFISSSSPCRKGKERRWGGWPILCNFFQDHTTFQPSLDMVLIYLWVWMNIIIYSIYVC